MANKYLAGIDIGTTGSKATIYDLQGNSVASGYHEYKCEYPKPNWVEQDADHIIASSMQSAKDAVDDAKIDIAEVVSISFSAQRCCSIFVDKDGKQVRPMISWQDARTADEVEDIQAKISPTAFYEITSVPLNTLWILTKMLWLRKNEPESWAKTDKVIQLQDYVLRSWGVDGYYNDLSDAGFYGFWDPFKIDWSDTLLDMFDISRSMLPVPTKSGTQVGTISKEISEKTGFKEGTPLCVGLGDQNAASLGAGVVEPGNMSVSLGTGCIAAAFLDQPFKDPTQKGFVTNHAIYGKWQLEGIQLGSAGVYRWFRDEITLMEKSKAETEERDVYAALDEMIASVPPGAKGLLLHPYFAGAATPRWNSSARGTITGLTFAHDRACLARCFMEGITLEIRDLMNALFDSGLEISTIRILGGPTKSSLWNQMQADIYNRKVETLINSDAAILGAAISAGVGVGVFEDFKDGVSKMVKVGKVYTPNQENVKVYDDLYAIYCKMYEGLDEKGVYEALAEFQK
jgi:xylulokinase